MRWTGILMAVLLLPFSAAAQVSLTTSEAESFELKTGDYTVAYKKSQNGQGWIKIFLTSAPESAIATKLANGPTRAYANAKALINRSMLDGIESQMDLERYSISDCGGSEDFVEGSDAIFNKRKPAFKGR